MSATNKALPKNEDGDFLPSSFDGQQDEWLPNTGKNGIPNVRTPDGENETLGAMADAPATDPDLPASQIAIDKGQLATLLTAVSKLTAISTQQASDSAQLTQIVNTQTQILAKLTAGLTVSGAVNAAVTFPDDQQVHGSVGITGALPAGANTLGKMDQGAPGGSPWPVQLTNRNVLDAGRKTDAANTDKTITPPSTFNSLSVINDGPNELRLCIDGDSTAGAKIIYIKPGEPFEKGLAGTVLHYSVASGTTTFRYILG